MSPPVESRECPVCGSSAWKQWPHPEGWIWRCPECTHAYTDPRSTFRETYDDQYYSETHRNWFKNPNLRLFDRVFRLIPKGDSPMGLLDVGCGRGDLLFHLHARNPSLRLTGVDLAPLPDHSQIQFVTNDVFRWEPGCEFDVVASLAVIEHVEDVRGFMERIRRFARRGGRIIVTTLNEDSTVYAAGLGLRRLGMTGPFDRLYSRHHRQHFTRRSMQRLAEETGLRVVESFTHNFPVAAIDFPSRGPWLDAIQRAGVAALFGLGRLSGRCFLQTLVCEV